MKNIKLLFLLVLSAVGMATASAQTLRNPKTGTVIAFEIRKSILNAPKCNGSEASIKKKVKAQLANHYTDYPLIAVDFTSFKGQNGYSDKEDPRKITYSYKIEMYVYLKRTIKKEGKEYSEFTTWEYDTEYQYITKPGRKCEFRIAPTSEPKLFNRTELPVERDPGY